MKMHNRGGQRSLQEASLRETWIPITHVRTHLYSSRGRVFNSWATYYFLPCFIFIVIEFLFFTVPLHVLIAHATFIICNFFLTWHLCLHTLSSLLSSRLHYITFYSFEIIRVEFEWIRRRRWHLLFLLLSFNDLSTAIIFIENFVPTIKVCQTR